MLRRAGRHIGGNVVAYVALFAALGGTSYAAVSLAPGSVTTTALKNGAVTNAKLARNSVGGQNLRRHSLTIADFHKGALSDALQSLTGKDGVNGTNGGNGSNGTDGKGGAGGPTGPMGPAGHDGSASIAMTAQSTGSVTAPHGASTTVPLSGNSWTQAAGDLDLITGSMRVSIPSACTGSFGNALLVSVDGVANTFGLAPTVPAGTTETIPFQVSELTQPGADTNHTITASLANSCTKSGEDYTVSNVKIDVVNFR